MINPKEFLNTAEELHALVIGAGEIIAPFPRMWHWLAIKSLDEIASEWHYYQLGRIIGVFTWLLISAIIKSIIF